MTTGILQFIQGFEMTDFNKITETDYRRYLIHIDIE